MIPCYKAVSAPVSELHQVTGHYWDGTSKRLRRIYVQDDTLRYSNPRGGQRDLVPLANGRFYLLLTTNLVYFVNFPPPAPGQPQQMVGALAGDEPAVFDAIVPASPSAAELEDYLGVYYSEDADAGTTASNTNVKLNEDGSVDMVFSPTAPKNENANWIKTVPGKGWLAGVRFYSPTQAFFDQTWKPDNIVKVQ